MLFAKMRHGVLEIAAGDERCYVEPPTLQRLSLLWTFRNFRRLSVSVLSHRQQQILEQLLEIAQQPSGERVNPELVIGRAEFSTYPRLKAPTVAESRNDAACKPAVERRTRLRPSDSTALSGLQKMESPAVSASMSARPAVDNISETGPPRPRRRVGWILAFASVVGCSMLALRIRMDQAQRAVPAIKASSSRSTASKPSIPQQENAMLAPGSRISPAAFRLTPLKNSAISVRSGSGVGLNSRTVPVLEPRSSSTGVQTNSATVRPNVVMAPRSVIYPVLPMLRQPGEANRQVLVRAVIDAHGTVTEVIVPGQDPRLTAAVTKAVKQWQYRPYLLNGQPAEVETLMMFTVLGQDAISVRFLPPGTTIANR